MPSFLSRIYTLLRPAVALLSLSVASLGYAEAPDSEPAATAYLDLGPAFTVNVGKPGAQLSYAKVELTLRLGGQPSLERAQHHQPALRDIMVSLLSNQPLEQVQDSDGREAIRAKALEQVKAFLEQEEGEALVTDLLFTTFVVQR